MRIGSMFSGTGGLDMAVEQVTGATPAWFVEHDAAPSKILAHHWPTVPNHHDVTTVDWATVEPVDILTGGSPCQDLSHAGKRAGMTEGTRSNLWVAMREAIAVLRPSLVVWENVRGTYSAPADSAVGYGPRLLGGADGGPPLRALGRVLGDLSDLGYDSRWVGLRAADVGAPHGRFRVFIVAHPNGEHGNRAGKLGPGRWGESTDRGEPPADTDVAGLERRPTLQRPGERPPRADSVEPDGGVTLLPTPRATRGGSATESTALLSTPKASDGPNGGPGMRNGRWQADAALPGVVSLLPTPTSQAAKHGGTPDVNANGYGSNLPSLVPDPATWGPYAPAIARWANVLGRPAPAPTSPGKDGRPRLSPLVVEFLMGLPAGHVTDPAIGLTRAQQLKALGNGVVPAQAAAALRFLLGGEPVGVGTGAARKPLPTPTARLGDSRGSSQHPDRRKELCAKRSGELDEVVEHLLPTGPA